MHVTSRILSHREEIAGWCVFSTILSVTGGQLSSLLRIKEAVSRWRPTVKPRPPLAYELKLFRDRKFRPTWRTMERASLATASSVSSELETGK
jgi:hypothetical protein